MIDRALRPVLERLFSDYPVVTVTGPRQSGKTTLCRAVFPELDYVNLERPDVRERALADPRGFLRRHGDGAVIDEVQRAPELMSYLQVWVDERRQNGQFVLTGSQNFQVSQAISQSLAGRTGILRLLPLSIAEALELRPELSVEEMLLNGFYPRIYDQSLDPTQALGDYFESYVERDVRQLSEIRHLTSFQSFVRLCAGRVGRLLNLSGLGADAGISHSTAREWLSVLEASFVAFRLGPYHANLKKRLVKAPKLYFYDVGLAAYLLGIEDRRQLFSHPLRGALFENLVVVEALKHRTNRGKRSNLFFYRDAKRHEVDLIYALADRFLAIEIKAGATVSRAFFQGLRKLREVLPEQVAGEVLVHDGSETYRREGMLVTHPRGFIEALKELEVRVLSGGRSADNDR